MGTILNTNYDFDQYKYLAQKALTNGPQCLLEIFFGGPDIDTSTTTCTCIMIQAHTNNYAALCQYYPKYMNKIFHLNNKLEMG